MLAAPSRGHGVRHLTAARRPHLASRQPLPVPHMFTCRRQAIRPLCSLTDVEEDDSTMPPARPLPVPPLPSGLPEDPAGPYRRPSQLLGKTPWLVEKRPQHAEGLSPHAPSTVGGGPGLPLSVAPTRSDAAPNPIPPAGLLRTYATNRGGSSQCGESAAAGTSGSGSGSACGAAAETRSEEEVVSGHVERQRAAPASKLDPVGARDDKQQLGGSDPAVAGPGRAGPLTHGSVPPVDHIRSPVPYYGYELDTEYGPKENGKKRTLDSTSGDDNRGGTRSVQNSATGKDNGNGVGNSGGGNGAGIGSGGGIGNGGGARILGSALSGPTLSGVPCNIVGYGTRSEVVARLPSSIMLLRHAECMTLDELQAHERVPNHDIPLSGRGVEQARLLGQRLAPVLAAAGMQLYVVTSPFLRCSETTRLVAEELAPAGLLSGCREAVQLREQDWGNFQDPRVQAECKEERLRYGRFYYRFPSGESVADVYDRLTIFQDHMVRDMCAGRFTEGTCVAIVSHGLTLRVFCMRWLHWTVRQFLQVYNIPNAEPVMLHKDVHPSYLEGDNAHLPFMPHHTKCLYRLTPRALELLRGSDASMATSHGCWQGQLLLRPPPPRSSASRSSDDDDRQWADVDGMV